MLFVGLVSAIVSLTANFVKLNL